MKYSEAMLKGFQMVGGRQCQQAFAKSKTGEKLWGREMPYSVCAHGAAMLGMYGDANHDTQGAHPAFRQFQTVWGISPAQANNGWHGEMGKRVGPPMDWRDIYGMAVAAGL